MPSKDIRKNVPCCNLRKVLLSSKTTLDWTAEPVTTFISLVNHDQFLEKKNEWKYKKKKKKKKSKELRRLYHISEQ